MQGPHIAVTGATGALGGRVVARLARRGVAQRLIVRDPSRAPKHPNAAIADATYLDRERMSRALEGIETVFFVSGFEAEDRLDHHRAAIEAFRDAGVQRVIYTSFLGAAPDATFTFARQHFETEEMLAAAGVSFVALRNSLYAELMPALVQDGEIRGPAGDGELAPVSREDIADVAAELLLGDEYYGERLDVTGPELLRMSDIAERLGESIGRSVTYVPESVEEAFASRTAYGAPSFEVEGWVSSYQAIATGEMAVVSNTVERIAGHPARSLRQILGRKG